MDRTTCPEKRKSAARRHACKQNAWAYTFIMPLLVGTMLFEVGPIFYSFYMSLTKWKVLSDPEFIGLKNFAKLFTDPQNLGEMLHTVVYVVVAVPVGVSIAVVLAVLLNRKMMALRPVYRTIFFMPTVVLPVVIALIWKWMFNTRFGIVNNFLIDAGFLPMDWLSSPVLSMAVIIAMGVWTFVGYDMVIILAGLQCIPQSYREAAEVDGANSFQSFFRITLPMLSPTLYFVITMEVINAFKLFDQIVVFAGGHVGNAMIADNIRTMVFGIYERGFRFEEMGYASAKAVLLFAIIMVVTVLQNILQKRWVHYD